MYCMLNFIQCSTVCPIFVLIINRYHINDSDSSYCKSSLNAGCLWVSIQQTLENTQQRVRRISTKASVWTSSASQSNIWKQFLSCNNKNTQHPRFQAQHIYIKPHCPLWSGLRKEAYTKIQLGLNVSSQRVHSMTTQLTESPTLARQRVLWGHSQIPQITLALHSDCPLAWKQFCGCRWKREGEGVSQKTYVLKCSVSVLSKCYDNFICVSNCVWSCKPFLVLGCRVGEQERIRQHGYCLLDHFERTGRVVKYTICPFLSHPAMFKFGEKGEALRLWTKGFHSSVLHSAGTVFIIRRLSEHNGLYRL